MPINIPITAVRQFTRATACLRNCLTNPKKSLYWAHQATLHVNRGYQIIARAVAKANRPRSLSYYRLSAIASAQPSGSRTPRRTTRKTINERLKPWNH